MTSCPNLGCVAIRKYTKERVQCYCDQMIVEKPEAYKLGMNLLELSEEPGSGYMIKMGLYSPEDLLKLGKKFPNEYQPVEWSELEEVVLGVGLIWIEGIERLYAHKIHNGRSPPNEEYYAKRISDRADRVKASKVEREEKKKREKVATKSEKMSHYQGLEAAVYKKKTLLPNGCVRVGVG